MNCPIVPVGWFEVVVGYPVDIFCGNGLHAVAVDEEHAPVTHSDVFAERQPDPFRVGLCQLDVFQQFQFGPLNLVFRNRIFLQRIQGGQKDFLGLIQRILTQDGALEVRKSRFAGRPGITVYITGFLALYQAFV